jgi:hypothetical protein
MFTLKYIIVGGVRWAAAAAELAVFEQAALSVEAPPEHSPPTEGPRPPAAGDP